MFYKLDLVVDFLKKFTYSYWFSVYVFLYIWFLRLIWWVQSFQYRANYPPLLRGNTSVHSMQCPRSDEVFSVWQIATGTTPCAVSEGSVWPLTLSSASLLGLRDFPHTHSCARGDELPREFPLRAALSSLVLYSDT